MHIALAPTVKQAVPAVIDENEVAEDGACHGSTGADLHAALSKVAELMGEDACQFGLACAVEQPDANLEVLADRQEDAPEGGVVEDAGVDVEREENALRTAASRPRGEGVDQGEERRAVRAADLEAARVAVAREGEDRFDEVEAEHQRQRAEPGSGENQGNGDTYVADAGKDVKQEEADGEDRSVQDGHAERD